MELLSILLLLALQRQWPELEPPAERDCPLSQLQSHSGAPWLAALLIAALVAALYYGLRQTLWGLPGLLLAMGSLWFACGRADGLRTLQAQRDCLQLNDLQGAALAGADGDSTEGGGNSPEQLLATLQRQQTRHYLQQWFAPVFWFCLLGPGGAVGYRLLATGAGTAARERANWLPARLLALAFSLTGDFQRAYPAAREQFLAPQANVELVDHCADAALPDPLIEQAEPGPSMEAHLAAREGLLKRTRVLWLCAIALAVIAL